jgi:hypothetical protein
MASPKRALRTDFHTPSRVPSDSLMANGSASSQQRTIQIELQNMEKYLRSLQFRHEREVGYSDQRDNRDLVIDATATNADQAMRDQTGYLKQPNPELQGAMGHGMYDGGTFAGDTRTRNKVMDQSLEAAKRALEDAEGAAPAAQAALIAELIRNYPDLASVTQAGYPDHPFTKLSALYSDGMNAQTIAGKRQQAKRELQSKQPKSFY